MTAAERQRRRRARLRDSKPVTKQREAQSAAAADGDAALQARIRELETELRHERERREAAEAKAAKAAPRDNKDEQLAELEARVRALHEIASHYAQQGSKGPPVRFTPAEYKLIDSLLHPGSIPVTDDPEKQKEEKKRTRAFQLWRERLPQEFFVVKPPPARPAPPDLPRTREELMAARLRRQAATRAKRAAARAAKRAPRHSIEERK
jgi:hypothetical protein